MKYSNVLQESEYYNNVLRQLVQEKLGEKKTDGFDAKRSVAITRLIHEHNIPISYSDKLVFADGSEVPEVDYGREATIAKVLELTNTKTYAEAHEVLRVKYRGAVYAGVSKELIKAGYAKCMADAMMMAWAAASGLSFCMGMGDSPIPVDAR